jgi:succinate dehydrogenase flavin-adding protein (antitoxin of CptAB toxin-antitoxin module)
MIVGRVTCLIWLGAAIFCCTMSAAGDKIAELQARFDHETNPVHRAKLLEKLGDAQFEETRRAFKANDLVTVGVVLEKYRDNARIAFEGLRKKRADAERDANGYRQLEIHVRRGIREVDEILLRIPEEFQPPLQIVRGDLDAIDRELIRMLFHHRDDQTGPSASPPPPSPAEAQP